MNNFKVMRYLKYVKPFTGYLLIILTLLLLSTLIGLVQPVMLKIIIDKVLVMKDIEFLGYVIAIMIAAYFISLIISLLNGFYNNYINQRLSIKLRVDMFYHMQKIKMSEYSKCNSGDFISKIKQDVDIVIDFLCSKLVSIVTNVLNILAAITLMMLFSWKLSIVALIITVIQSIISVKFSGIIKENQKELREKDAKHIGFLKQAFEFVKSAKAFRREKHSQISYFSTLREILNLQFKSFYIGNGYGSLISLTTFIGSILIFSIGVFEIYRGNLSIGTLFVFDSISSRFNQFVMAMVNLNLDLQRVFVSCERVESILNLDNENLTSGIKKIGNCSISFKNVSFKYADKWIIRDFTFCFEPGKTYAVLGASGAGKTTLANLLFNFYPVNSGSILIGNEDIQSINIKSLRKKVSIVFQDAILTYASIEDNIRFGDNKASMEDIRKVAGICCIDEYISTLPEGYGTIVGEGGITLSGGQKQRIALARALLSNADIYIFDELSSHLDKNMEYDICRNIREALRGKMQIYITHNVKLSKLLDCVLILDSGKISGYGSHEELLENDALYKELYFKGETIACGN